MLKSAPREILGAEPSGIEESVEKLLSDDRRAGRKALDAAVLVHDDRDRQPICHRQRDGKRVRALPAATGVGTMTLIPDVPHFLLGAKGAHRQGR
jgi:hypothetical protein